MTTSGEEPTGESPQTREGGARLPSAGGRAPKGSRWWLAVAGLLLIGLAGWAVWRRGGLPVGLLRDQERLRAWLDAQGAAAPLISIALNTAQVLLAPAPGQVLGLANGYLFGVFWGTVYSLIGVMLGSAIAMGLGRWLGRPVVERFVESARLARWDGVAQRRGPLFFFLVFLLPLVPDDIACFAIGLSRLSIPYILILAAVGRLPGLVVSSWIGAKAGALSPLGWALLGAGTLLLAGVALRYRERLESAIWKQVER